MQAMSVMRVSPNIRNIGTCAVGLFFLYLAYVIFFRNPTDGLPPKVTIDLKDLMSYAILATIRGGHAVRMIHAEKQLQVQSKGETKEGAKELLTKADLTSNALMLETLDRFPGLSVVSEEKVDLPDADVDPYRKASAVLFSEYSHMLAGAPSRSVSLPQITMWIDPLDATQEYTEDLLQYVTVMACIAVDGKPTFGVIHRPFHNQTVWGLTEHGIFPKVYGSAQSSTDAKTIIVSRSHSGKVAELKDAAFTEANWQVEPAGGAGYKTLRVLNNTAEFYVHVTAIKKWDICAGDAIIRAAGGKMTTLQKGGETITYYADENVKNELGLLVTRKDHFTYLEKMEPHLSKVMA